MKTRLICSVAMGALLASGSVLANPWHHKGFADGGPGPMGGPPEIGMVLHLAHRLEMVADEIGLTDEQRDAIHAVVDQARPQLRDLAREMRGNRDALRDASAPGSYDPAAVAGLAANQGDLIERGIVLGAQVRHDVLSVLTQDQRAQLEALRAEHRGRGPRPG